MLQGQQVQAARPAKSWPADGRTLLSMLQSSSETFFRKFRFWDGGGQDAPPVFEVDGIHYLHVKVRSGSWVLSDRTPCDQAAHRT